ncbi:hypothetical protein NPIL_58941 [Nephila pilipes]|uniref:Uncharacterized protein n=1 Tax=Nephila pilipes TaxID=299642 RepID=A0A8X6PXA6_NEPPI|nr:hypothetical protein NPIL_58941 [Nephila pilipes]
MDRLIKETNSYGIRTKHNFLSYSTYLMKKYIPSNQTEKIKELRYTFKVPSLKENSINFEYSQWLFVDVPTSTESVDSVLEISTLFQPNMTESNTFRKEKESFDDYLNDVS